MIMNNIHYVVVNEYLCTFKIESNCFVTTFFNTNRINPKITFIVLAYTNLIEENISEKMKNKCRFHLH